MNKLALGTAQFGLDYGINNIRGKIPKAEAFNILDIAQAGGIESLDTAAAYGDSEKIIGEYLYETGKKIEVVSKLSANSKEQAESGINRSLENLRSESIYGYLLHDFKQYCKWPEIWQALEKYKSEGKIKNIGFSLYYPEDLKAILNNGIKFDLIQIPYSVFDQRFAQYFEQLKSKEIKIYVRSVFLQGLVFKKPNELSGKLSGISGKLAALASLSNKARSSVAAICLNFAVINNYIDKVVVGVDNAANIKEILNVLNDAPKVEGICKELSSLKEDNEEIILPFNWVKEKAIA